MERLSYSTLPDYLHGEREIYDIWNAIRNDSSDFFQNYTSNANAKNITEIGDQLFMHKTLQNEFIASLVDRIAGVIMHRVELQNPFAKFKTSDLNYGRTIEEIFVDLCEEHVYDPDTAETEVFKREKPDVKTVFHSVNREANFKQTIQDGNLRRAFTSWNEFGDFVSGVINAMYNSDSFQEFQYVKLAIESFYSKGLMATEKVTPVVDLQTSKDFAKSVRKSVRKMTMQPGTRNYNAMAVNNIAKPEDLHLFINADLETEVDVELLAQAFNMDKTSFNANVTVIEDFAVPGLEAVIVDKSFFVFKDVLKDMESIRNPQGLYWNYWLHRHQMISCSPFAPAVAFTSDENAPSVTSVILSPMESSIRAGNSMNFRAHVRQTDKEKREVTYTVESVDSQLASDTTIDATTGKLTISPQQSGKLKVSASVDYETEIEGEEGTETESVTVTGEAFVFVKPVKN